MHNPLILGEIFQTNQLYLSMADICFCRLPLTEVVTNGYRVREREREREREGGREREGTGTGTGTARAHQTVENVYPGYPSYWDPPLGLVHVAQLYMK